MAYTSFYFPSEDSFMHSALQCQFHVEVGEHVYPGSVVCEVALSRCNYVTRVLYRTDVEGTVSALYSARDARSLYPGGLLCQIVQLWRHPAAEDRDAYQLELCPADQLLGSCPFGGSSYCLCRQLMFPSDS